LFLTPREQRIVLLLAAGRSEEATAAELGLSRRTVAYALRALMNRLGVDNRFQLGLALGNVHADTPLLAPEITQLLAQEVKEEES
jgi:DNA-binding NarL/FixJ family response regulator